MKATETRYYYNADENLCADEDFVIYFLCGMEGLTAEEAREGLHTKREFYGWFDTFFKCADESSHPHWASWSPLGAELNFHTPEYFQELYFE